ncbi:MAG: protein tyrosine phosphatase family protein [Oceanicoccus sp.]
MALNTLKTSVGFLATMLRKYTPLHFEKKSIDGIYNYLEINNSLCSSGQPTEDQFALIQQSGYTSIINLAPHNIENSIDDEASTLSALGLNYIHIPVDFQNPTDSDFDTFVDAIQSTTNEKVWVHCAANMRASAFIYRYRCSVMKEEESTARQDIEKIWQPFGVWKKFLSGVTRSH